MISEHVDVFIATFETYGVRANGKPFDYTKINYNIW